MASTGVKSGSGTPRSTRVAPGAGAGSGSPGTQVDEREIPTMSTGRVVAVRRGDGVVHGLPGDPGHALLGHQLGRDEHGVAVDRRHALEQPAEMLAAADLDRAALELCGVERAGVDQPRAERRVGRHARRGRSGRDRRRAVPRSRRASITSPVKRRSRTASSTTQPGRGNVPARPSRSAVESSRDGHAAPINDMRRAVGHARIALDAGRARPATPRSTTSRPDS